MMRKRLTIIFLFLVAGGLSAQKDYRAILDIRGGTSEFCISKDSTIWIATKTGDTYYTDDFYKPWKYGTFRSDENDMVSGMTFERASFFNKDTGYISGFIQKGGKQDFIYWTNDGGKNWQEIKFGLSSWIDANYIDYDGNAWMSGSSQLIYYSNDFGKTWYAFDKIEPKSNLRVHTIYFEDSQKGIIGDNWNRIYMTYDNCKSWIKIPSPLDQNKYERIYKNERPTVYKAQIFNNNIIVNQQNKIFYTKIDTINWIELDDFIDFTYDKYSKKLFAISKDFKIHLLDSTFSIKWTSAGKLKTAPISIKALNGALYTWHWLEMYKINEQTFEYTPLYTLEHPIETPYITAKAIYKSWGINGSEIYQSDDKGKSWYRIELLPFYIGNFKAINDQEAIISDYNNQKFYHFLIIGDSSIITDYTIIKPLEEFLQYDIVEVTFETGSQGCFHAYLRKVEYSLKNDSIFSTSKDEILGDKPDISRFNNTFHKAQLLDLLKSINDNPYYKIQTKEFNITAKDIADYKAKIESIQKKYNKDNSYSDFEDSRFKFPYTKIDFDFYYSNTDSINSFDTNKLNEIFGTKYGNFSTTTNWIGITIKNKHGKEITISNSDDIPNAWYLPWTVTSDGLSFPINMLDITKFIESNTPQNFLFTSNDNKNVLAIFQMIDYLYREKLEK